MKLGYCAFDEFLGTDFPVVVDCHVVGMSQNPSLVIDNILDISGKASLLHNENKLYRDIGHHIADMAERDSTLLAEAVARAAYGEAA
jgi:hypothetical protein